MHDIDISIIKACKAKDTRAEYALYRECYATLIRICKRYAHNNDDAVDLLNKGFLKVLNKIKTYDEGKPFHKWAKSIMINTIIDEFRLNKRYNNTFTHTDEIEFSVSAYPVDVNAAESKISMDEMMRVIQKLPEGNREVFNLYVFEGLSHRQISKKLDIPEGTSRWLLSIARIEIRKRFASVLSGLKVLML